MRKALYAAAALALAMAGHEALGQSAPAQPAAAPAATAPTPAGGLPDGAGRDTLVRLCSSCHAPDVVAGTKRSPQEWHDMVHLMAERSGEGTEKELAEITAYLVKNFGAPTAP